MTSLFSKINKQAIIIMLSKLFPMKTIERICQYKVLASDGFMFKGNMLRYYFHSYNNFGLTERVIEIPIIKYYLLECDYKHVLEIGNVTNHYYDDFKTLFANKCVVDKYEKAYNVINIDIATYVPQNKFDMIFSISTFEHMDSDLGRNHDYVKGRSKLISVAADNIKHVSDNLIKESGKFIITAPLLYNYEWDETFYSDAFEHCGFSSYKRFLYKRMSELNWMQVDVEAGRNLEQNPYSDYREYLSVVEFVK